VEDNRIVLYIVILLAIAAMVFLIFGVTAVGFGESS
jgi:hypothetical protein